MGINAHPGQISAISVSHDGKYFFTAGGSDLSAYMFEIGFNDNKDDDDNDNNHLNNLNDPSNLLSRKTSNMNLNLNSNLN